MVRDKVIVGYYVVDRPTVASVRLNASITSVHWPPLQWSS